MRQLLICVCGLTMAAGVALSAETYVVGEPTGKTFTFAQRFLDQHCLECHDNDTMKGNLSLEELGPIEQANAGQWKSIWAQVALKEMPPKKKTQPEVIDRLLFADWVVEELSRTMKDKGGFMAHRHPKKGNFLDHDLLFGELPDSIQLKPAASPARLWRVSKQEYITRMNILVHKEPEYNASRKGLRTYGDAVPMNSNGGFFVYLGQERVIRAKGASIGAGAKRLGPVLSSIPKYGLENYPHLYTVNSAESVQILNMGNELLRYMAYGPLSFAQPEQMNGKLGPESGFTHFYRPGDIRPLTPVYELMNGDVVDDDKLVAAIDYLFDVLVFRPPTEKERQQYINLVKNSTAKMGKEKGIILGLSGIFLHRDALFRPELAETGKADKHGRVMLQDWELGLAVNHALRYLTPDDALKQAVQEGRMRTRDDVRREVTRMLSDDSVRKPRVLQFFRDYFDHDLAGYICKDNGKLTQAGFLRPWKDPYYFHMFSASASTDRVIELILEEDKDVFRQLLTTPKVVTSQEAMYLGRRLSETEMDARLEENKKRHAEDHPKLTAEKAALDKRASELETKISASPGDKALQSELAKTKKELSRLKHQIKTLTRSLERGGLAVQYPKLEGSKISVRSSRLGFGGDRNPALPSGGKLSNMPEGERMGILTHPAWLVSHTDANGNHPIHRGIWVRERLLGGGIPDVPITVDAQLPDEPENTLRHRMRVTREKYCWSCHSKMDPLGLPFEMYNHIGLIRSEEKGKPVDTSGEIIDSGVPGLDGEVTDAIDMIKKIVATDRAEQVFVRHAFRFWMGRNETLNDRQVIQDAYKAYKENDGSMNALIVSLLTSDAFLYRTP